MKFKSFSKDLKGTVKEVLGTAFSVGCQVDGKSPKAISDAIEAGEIDSTPPSPSPSLLLLSLFMTQYEPETEPLLTNCQPQFPKSRIAHSPR